MIRKALKKRESSGSIDLMGSIPVDRSMLDRLNYELSSLRERLSRLEIENVVLRNSLEDTKSQEVVKRDSTPSHAENGIVDLKARKAAIAALETIESVSMNDNSGSEDEDDVSNNVLDSFYNKHKQEQAALAKTGKPLEREATNASQWLLNNRLSMPYITTTQKYLLKSTRRGINNATMAGGSNTMLKLPTTSIIDIEHDKPFLEFGEFGVAHSIMSGRRTPNLVGGQPVEQLSCVNCHSSASPVAESLADQLQLANFSFPRGASLAAVHVDNVSKLAGPQLDTFHILQFTNGEGGYSYAVCMTITEEFRNPCQALLRNLLEQRAKRMHAARILKRFAYRCACWRINNRHRRPSQSDAWVDTPTSTSSSYIGSIMTSAVNSNSKAGALSHDESRRSSNASTNTTGTGASNTGTSFIKDVMAKLSLSKPTAAVQKPPVCVETVKELLARDDEYNYCPGGYAYNIYVDEDSESTDENSSRENSSTHLGDDNIHTSNSSASTNTSNTAATTTSNASSVGSNWAVVVQRSFVMVSMYPNHTLLIEVMKRIVEQERDHGYLGQPMKSVSSTGTLRAPPSSASNSHHPPGPGNLTRRNSMPPPLPERKKSSELLAYLRRKASREKLLDNVLASADVKQQNHYKISDPYTDTVFEVKCIPLEIWTCAILFKIVSADMIVKAVHWLLLEQSLIVAAEDMSAVTVITTALHSLLRPLTWCGTFTPLLPDSLLEHLDSPCPMFAGIVKPFSSKTLCAAKLDLDKAKKGRVISQRMSLHRCETDGIESTTYASEEIVDPAPNSLLSSALSAGNDVEAAGSTLFQGWPCKRELRRLLWSYSVEMSSDDIKRVKEKRRLVRQHIEDLCGDVTEKGAWRRYGTVKDGEYQFTPDWFIEPLLQKLSFQTEMIQTMQFSQLLHELRDEELKTDVDAH